MKLIIMALMLTLSSNAYAEYKRSQKAKNQFKQSQPCPATGKSKGSCPGWIIDHVKPLACGGADHPSNLQWQTKHDAKMKDKWERKGC